MRRRSTALVSLALALPAAGGCSYVNQFGPSSCDRSEDGNPPEDYVGGKVVDGVYQSSDPTFHADAGADAGSGLSEEEEKAEAELLWFPGGMRYRIIHKLGVAPTWWQVYLSFGQYGAYEGESTLAEAAGNQAEVRDVNSDDFLVINGSCSDYWMLVIAGNQESAP